MGKILQLARLQNTGDVLAAQQGQLPKRKVRSAEVTLLVDTGAAMLCLTPDVIQKLGLLKEKERDVITGNGLARRSVYNPVRIEILGRETDMNAMEIPEGTPMLLGYLPLQALDLYPNPRKRILEGNPAYGGKMVVDLL